MTHPPQTTMNHCCNCQHVALPMIKDPCAHCIYGGMVAPISFNFTPKEEVTTTMEKNCLTLHGIDIDLTPDQIAKITQIVDPATPFDRGRNQLFYYMTSDGKINSTRDTQGYSDGEFYSVANYCTDKTVLQRRLLQEILDRRLWRFKKMYDRKGPKPEKTIYSIASYQNKYTVIPNDTRASLMGGVYFRDSKVAERAIKEIVLPFMEEHADYCWGY